MANPAVVVALLLLQAAAASAWNLPSGPGNSNCPVISGEWANGGISDGLIFNENNAFLAKIEDATIMSINDCVARCATTLHCAFYSFLDFKGDHSNDCYLFSCGACTSGTSFSFQASVTAQGGNLVASLLTGVLPGLGVKTYTYKSGASTTGLPQCNGVKGDPHFSGADNSHFEFTGTPNTTYALLSDAHVHINMFLGGRYAQWGTESALRPLTWIRQIGILSGTHTIALKAREGPRWQYDGGYMSSIEVDGNPVALNQEGDASAFDGGRIRITWVASQLGDGDDEIDVYLVEIADVMTLRLKLRPEVAHLRTESDGVVHFSMELPQVFLSEHAHGVLGQTYRRDHRNRLSAQKLVYSKLLGTEVVPAENGKSFLDGEPEDYATSELLRADCKLSRFAQASGLDTETARAIEISAGSAYSKHALPKEVLRLGPASVRKFLRK